MPAIPFFAQILDGDIVLRQHVEYAAILGNREFLAAARNFDLKALVIFARQFCFGVVTEELVMHGFDRPMSGSVSDGGHEAAGTAEI